MSRQTHPITIDGLFVLTISILMLVLKYMSRQAPSYWYRWFIFTKLMEVLSLVEVAEHYQDNIIYRDNLLNIIELY